MSDLVAKLRSIDHESVEDCFCQSPLFAQAADEIERLRERLDGSVTKQYAAELGRQVDELEAENAKLRGQLVSAKRALKRLTNEVAGVWDAFEIGIRQEISNTNYAVVREKITEAESVLAALTDEDKS